MGRSWMSLLGQRVCSRQLAHQTPNPLHLCLDRSENCGTGPGLAVVLGALQEDTTAIGAEYRLLAVDLLAGCIVVAVVAAVVARNIAAAVDLQTGYIVGLEPA